MENNTKQLDGIELYNYLIEKDNCSEEIALQIMINNKKDISFFKKQKITELYEHLEYSVTCFYLHDNERDIYRQIDNKIYDLKDLLFDVIQEENKIK